MGATPIDNNDADEKSGKLYSWLLIIRCTRTHATIRKRSVMLPFSIKLQHIRGTAIASNSMSGKAAHRGASV